MNLTDQSLVVKAGRAGPDASGPPAARTEYLFSVAQTSKSAVSRVSKPACSNVAEPAWKPAIQQVWKPALRNLGRFALNRCHTECAPYHRRLTHYL